MRQAAKQVIRHLTAPLFARVPISRWPTVMGRIHDLSIPKSVVPNPRPEPRGAADINILFELLDRTAGVEGAIAECGVYRGCTLVAMAIYLQQTRSAKLLYGFDSFQGFGEVIEYDLRLQTAAVDSNKRADGFANTSCELICRKLELFGLSNVRLIPGFFEMTLRSCPETRFSFVHLDCDAYASYRDCLRHFYPLVSRDGIITLDEYNDPPWPGCNQAVDEFLADKAEKLEEICRDNHIKYYFVKGSSSPTYTSQKASSDNAERAAGSAYGPLSPA
jgi:O-methyltransferase